MNIMLAGAAAPSVYAEIMQYLEARGYTVWVPSIRSWEMLAHVGALIIANPTSARALEHPVNMFVMGYLTGQHNPAPVYVLGYTEKDYEDFHRHGNIRFVKTIDELKTYLQETA